DRFWGRNMFLASAEYRRPFAQALTGVLFVDVGDAWGSRTAFQFDDPTLRTRFRQNSGFSPHAAAGVGRGVTTPIGPIRLDDADQAELKTLQNKDPKTDKDKARIADLQKKSQMAEDEWRTLQQNTQPTDAQKSRLSELTNLRSRNTTALQAAQQKAQEDLDK